MARGKKSKTRTRTIVKTKTRHVFSKARSSFGRRHKSGHKKLDHATVILEGAGIGSVSSIGTTIALGNNKPKWLSPLVAFISGLGIGKMQTKKWESGIEEGLSAVATAYVTDRVINGEQIIPSLQQIGQGGGISGGILVY